MSNLNDSILVNPSDEHIKALLSKLAYENLMKIFPQVLIFLILIVIFP